MADHIRGTDGYAQQAGVLLRQYEQIPFETAHAKVLDLIPQEPSLILDVGSGTGRDAGHLAAMGHRVTAIEPTDALRIAAMRLHPSPLIDWIDDGLPDLRQIRGHREKYDLVMMTAVWMHLDKSDREIAMPVVASLLRPGGYVIMSLRHGPVPQGRRMFDVSAEETIDLAAKEQLIPLRNFHTKSLQEPNRSAGVTWTRLAFGKPQ